MTIPSLNLVFAGAWDRFSPYGGLHLVTVCVCVLAVAALGGIGRAVPDTSKMALRLTLGIFGITYWVFSYSIRWYRNGLDLPSGLPLHLCELNGLIAPLALLTLNRWLRATAYFWTFALTTQAFIQPITLTIGPAAAFFWWFWALHTIVLACAVYDLAVVGFRPNWQDLWRVYVVSALYLAIVIPVNLEFGTNFGFLGNPSPAKVPPFIDALGPWPLRALIVVALAAAAFAILVLPWRERTSKLHKST